MELFLIFLTDAFEKRDTMQQGAIRVNRAEVSMDSGLDLDLCIVHLLPSFQWLRLALSC